MSERAKWLTMLTNGVTSRYGHAHKRETPSGEHIRPLSSLLSVLTRTCLCTSCVPACTCACVYVSVFYLYVLRVTCLPAAGRNREREQRVREIEICWDTRKTLGDSWLGGVYSLCVYRTDYTHADTHTRVPICIHTDSNSRDDTVCKFAKSLHFIMQMSFITAGET